MNITQAFDPKRIQQPGERPVRALINRGIEYLEVRAIDLNPFAPNGITEYEASLITLLMTASALADSPFNNPEERIAIDGINARASWAGRRSDQRFDERSSFKEAGIQFLAALDPLADSLNKAFQSDSFTGALKDARLRLDGTYPLLSEEIENAALNEGHLEFGLTRAQKHHDNWKTVSLTPDALVTMKKRRNRAINQKKKSPPATKAHLMPSSRRISINPNLLGRVYLQ